MKPPGCLANAVRYDVSLLPLPLVDKMSMSFFRQHRLLLFTENGTCSDLKRQAGSSTV